MDEIKKELKIERLWKFFKKKVMRGKYYVGFLDFKESVTKFFTDISIYKPELKGFYLRISSS
ncbi:MAG: hypothetical protein V2A53_09180 [bacterium]